MKKIPTGLYGFARQLCTHISFLVDVNYLHFQVLQKEQAFGGLCIHSGLIEWD